MATKLIKGKRQKAEPICMVCKVRPVLQREVCSSCLSAANRRIAKPKELDEDGKPPKGKITEEQAIAKKLIGKRDRLRADWNKAFREKFPDVEL